MLRSITDLPDGVVGFEAIGEVTADDYEKVLVPAFEAAHATYESVNLLYVLGSDFTGYGEGAEWEDAKFGMTHWSGWGRIAVVTDTEWVRHLLKVFGWMAPGEVKLFSTAELDDAKTWVAGS
jgi:hypothetical protein